MKDLEIIIMFSNMSQHVVEGINAAEPKPLTPHKLIQIGWQHVYAAAMHCLYFGP